MTSNIVPRFYKNNYYVSSLNGYFFNARKNLLKFSPYTFSRILIIFRSIRLVTKYCKFQKTCYSVQYLHNIIKRVKRYIRGRIINTEIKKNCFYRFHFD